jgi:ubiquinone/menaquinone biosynthesis C-methylase UbiE
MNHLKPIDFEAVDRAFSKQAEHYDSDDAANTILIDWRQQVYDHVDQFLKPQSFILELNAGTGIDALRFVKRDHRVLATDLSVGMVDAIRKKIKQNSLLGRLSCQQCSFEKLEEIKEKNFDFIFSNFGGLNCSDNLSKVTRNFSSLLKPGGYVTLVIMPPVSFWEWLWIFKGYRKKAFRRFSKNGSAAHLEGEFFTTYYYSLSAIRKSLGKDFRMIKSQSLGLVSPPPSKEKFPQDHPVIYGLMKAIDSLLRAQFPFNRWGDHIIVTFQSTFKTP